MWRPLGGYVKFKGDMNPASTPSDEWLSLPPEERAGTFQAKPVWQRFIIVAAGPVTNFLFAILAFIAIFAAIGYPTTPPIVHGVVEAGPADRPGFRPGDRIVAANGRSIAIFADHPSYVRLQPEQPDRLTVWREGEPLQVHLMPEAKVIPDRFGHRAPTVK